MIWVYHICLSINQLMDSWVLPIWAVMNNAAMNAHV